MKKILKKLIIVFTVCMLCIITISNTNALSSEMVNTRSSSTEYYTKTGNIKLNDCGYVNVTLTIEYDYNLNRYRLYNASYTSDIDSAYILSVYVKSVTYSPSVGNTITGGFVKVTVKYANRFVTGGEWTVTDNITI